MSKPRNPLIYTASVAVLVVAGAIWMVATEAASALHHVGLAADAWAVAPALLGARVAALQGSVDALPGKVLPPVLNVVDAARRDVTARADAQITALRGDLMPRVDKIEADASARMGEAVAAVAGIRQDAQPLLVNSAALAKDAQDSWDSNYWDVVSLLNSAEVATTSVAQASEAMRDAAPKVAASVVGIGKSVDGIAADVHTATTDFVKPRTGWQKFKMWLETVGKIGARII